MSTQQTTPVKIETSPDPTGTPQSQFPTADDPRSDLWSLLVPLFEASQPGLSKYVTDVLGATSYDLFSVLLEHDFITPYAQSPDRSNIPEDEDVLPTLTAVNPVVRRCLITTALMARTYTATDMFDLFFQVTTIGRWSQLCSDFLQRELETESNTLNRSTISTYSQPINHSISSDFAKGVKRDIKAFRVLRDPSKWKSWLDSFLATARAQLVDEPFNPKFTPFSDEEKELFELKQRYCYSVLQETIKTPEGAGIVRKYAATTDAQAAYAEVIDSLTHGTAGLLDEKQAEDRLKALSLSDAGSEPLVNHLTKFTSLLMDWQTARGEKGPVDESEQLRILKDSVQKHTKMDSEVRHWERINLAVQNIPGVDKEKMNSYGSLFNHLRSFALNEDNRRQKSRAGNRPRPRNVNNINRTDDQKNKYREIKNKFWLERDVWNKMNEEQRKKHLEKKKNALKEAGLSSPFKRTGRSASQTEQTKKNSEQARELHVHFAGSTVTQTGNNNPETALRNALINATKATEQTQATEAARSQDAGNFIDHILKTAENAAAGQSEGNKDVVVKLIDGKTWYSVSNIIYKLRNLEETRQAKGSLVDGGANGGLAGEDMAIIATHPSIKIDISAACDGEEKDLPSQTMAGYVQSHKGPIIVLTSHYAGYNKGRTIHSKGQFEHFGLQVDDRSRQAGGKQRIVTPDGYIIPLSIRNGLPYMDMRKPTKEELENPDIPQVWLTADDNNWDPSVLDNEYQHSEVEDAPEALADVELDYTVSDNGELLDEFLYSNNKVGITAHETREREVDKCIQIAKNIHERKYTKYEYGESEADFDKLLPNFLHIPVARIKKTLSDTTQFFRAENRLPFRKHYRSRFPGANVFRHDDEVAHDTFVSTVPAFGDRSELP